MGSVIEGSGIQDSSYAKRGGVAEDISRQGSEAEGLAQAGKEQVKRIGGVTRERVYHQVDGRKEELVRGLHGLADSLQGAGKQGNLGVAQSLVEGAVGVIHRLSDRLERGSTEELMRDAQRQVRERPGLFIACCVAVGFFAGRLVKL